MDKTNKKRKKGFTILEILVVVLIIGILAAIALPAYFRAVEKSRVSEPINILGTIAKAQKRHKMQNLGYTTDVSDLDLSYSKFSDGNPATGSEFDGEYFDYKVYGDDEKAALAKRNNGEYELSILYETDTIYCRPADNSTCKELGFAEGRDYGSSGENSGDSSQGTEPEPEPEPEPVNPCLENPSSDACCEYTGDWTPCTPVYNPCDDDPYSEECCEYSGDWTNCYEPTCEEQYGWDTFAAAECNGNVWDYCSMHWGEGECCGYDPTFCVMSDPCIDFGYDSWECAEWMGNYWDYCNSHCGDWNCEMMGYYCTGPAYDVEYACSEYGTSSYECCSADEEEFRTGHMYYNSDDCYWYRCDYNGDC